MTTALLGYLKAQKKIQNKVEAIDFPQVNWKMICISAFFISLALLVFYVWQISYLTRGYYLINNYEKQISVLSSENQNLQVSFAENSFLGQVSQEAQAMNFQKATGVEYIQIPAGSVAFGATQNNMK